MNTNAGQSLKFAKAKSFWFVIVLPMLMLALSSCVVSSPAIDGRVVDAQTHEPIEGANVLAHWVLGYTLLEYQSAGELQVLEAITDRDGRFHIPKWTRVRSPFSRGSLQAGEDPEVLIFKEGYSLKKGLNFPREVERRMLSAAAGEGQLADSIRPKEWAGWEFKLRRSEGDAKQQENEIEGAFNALLRIVSSPKPPQPCWWADASRMLLAVDAAYSRVTPEKSAYLLRLYKDEIAACHQSDKFGWEVKK